MKKWIFGAIAVAMICQGMGRIEGATAGAPGGDELVITREVDVCTVQAGGERTKQGAQMTTPYLQVL